jgi:hypothetical protein
VLPEPWGPILTICAALDANDRPDTLARLIAQHRSALPKLDGEDVVLFGLLLGELNRPLRKKIVDILSAHIQ